ncbi:hypothetical protein AWB72_00642 [Caballeronia concitans]|uniref:Uncharacterized protein n=1 Tax=Caballeronia concitans TaxID=1777133 RepID=A0A658QRQ0_9BURK|nr:hypothetical protein AWB72_00642 [Caballeronia concitans]
MGFLWVDGGAVSRRIALGRNCGLCEIVPFDEIARSSPGRAHRAGSRSGGWCFNVCRASRNSGKMDSTVFQKRGL